MNNQVGAPEDLDRDWNWAVLSQGASAASLCRNPQGVSAAAAAGTHRVQRLLAFAGTRRVYWRRPLQELIECSGCWPLQEPTGCIGGGRCRNS